MCVKACTHIPYHTHTHKPGRKGYNTTREIHAMKRQSAITVLIASYLCSISTTAFHLPAVSHATSFRLVCDKHTRRPHTSSRYLSGGLSDTTAIESENIWESVALKFADFEEGSTPTQDQLKDFVQYISLLRVGVPAFALALSAHVAYPFVALTLANLIDDSGVFAVVAMDASQYIQNILTTSGLVFSLLVGQTYYFMYQQQEAIYLALFEEVTAAKSLLEQVALVSQGRESLYQRILKCIYIYVHEDLKRFNADSPAELLSARPADDPLEDILYLTSVGEPSTVYQTVRSLRQARAYRLGALQRKLPDIHMTLLWVLFGIVLFTFPLLGAGSQTIGGLPILQVQSWYIGFIVFGMSLTMGIVYELQSPGERGAYNALLVLNVMVSGLVEEIDQRMNGKIGMKSMGSPSVDADGYFNEVTLLADEDYKEFEI